MRADEKLTAFVELQSEIGGAGGFIVAASRNAQHLSVDAQATTVGISYPPERRLEVYTP